MKRFFRIFLIVLVISFSSCEKKEIIETNEVETVQTNVVKNISLKSAENSNISSITTEERKQWLTYLVAQTLIVDDFNAKEYFFDNYSNANIIQLDDLFQVNPPNYNYNSFRNAFEIQYMRYQRNIACPKNGIIQSNNNDRTKPTSRPSQATPGNSNGDRLYFYLEELSGLEIFMPNTYTIGQLKIRSTADTAYGTDEGFLHNDECNVNKATVNPYDLNRVNNIIIAREISHVGTH